MKFFILVSLISSSLFASYEVTRFSGQSLNMRCYTEVINQGCVDITRKDASSTSYQCKSTLYYKNFGHPDVYQFELISSSRVELDKDTIARILNPFRPIKQKYAAKNEAENSLNKVINQIKSEYSVCPFEL